MNKLAGLCLAAIALVLVACSKEAPPPQVGAPLVTADTAGPIKPETLNGSVTAAGIPTQYSAAFVENQLRTINETRQAGATTQSGGYEFYGARLTRYNGAALQGGMPIELEFDLGGAITKSRAGAGEVPAEEINAIRARAQLLRSHALAQRSVRAHASP